MSLIQNFGELVRSQDVVGKTVQFQAASVKPRPEFDVYAVQASDGEYVVMVMCPYKGEEPEQGAIYSGTVTSMSSVANKKGSRPCMEVSSITLVEKPADIIGSPSSLRGELLANLLEFPLEKIEAGEYPDDAHFAKLKAGASAPASAPADAPAAKAAEPVPVATSTPANAPSAVSTATLKNEPEKKALKRPKGIQPIEGVTPFVQGWTIRGRATQKSDVRHFNSARGEGKLFNFTLVDETGEIRVTGFTQQVDKFFDLVRDGQVYLVSDCRVVAAKKQFSNVNNDFELMLNDNTKIELSPDQDVAMPTMLYNFIKLDQLSSVEPNATCDVLGVIKNVRDVQSFVAKSSGRPFEKRDVVLADDTGYEVNCTLWGDEAKNFDVPTDTVVALKGAKVSDFDGRSLSALRSTQITVSPDVREAYQLKGWYDAEGHAKDFKNMRLAAGASEGANRDTTFKTIKEVLDSNLGSSPDRAEYFNVRACIANVFRRGLTYPACTEQGCNKKVIQETDGQWRCDKSNKVMPEPKYRYMALLSIADGINSDGLRVSVFDEAGEIILGRPASEIHQLTENMTDNELAAVLRGVEGDEYEFRIRARLETYNETSNVRYQVLSAVPLREDNDAAMRNMLQQLGL